MKTLISILSLAAVSMIVGNQPQTKPVVSSTRSAWKISKVTSINGMKNGQLFINYLGAKQEGC